MGWTGWEEAGGEGKEEMSGGGGGVGKKGWKGNEEVGEFFFALVGKIREKEDV